MRLLGQTHRDFITQDNQAAWVSCFHQLPLPTFFSHIPLGLCGASQMGLAQILHHSWRTPSLGNHDLLKALLTNCSNFGQEEDFIFTTFAQKWICPLPICLLTWTNVDLSLRTIHLGSSTIMVYRSGSSAGLIIFKIIIQIKYFNIWSMCIYVSNINSNDINLERMDLVSFIL